MTADNNELRLRLLPWIQEHWIRSYNDEHVLSHTEAVEQLVAVIEGRPVPRFHDPIAGELHPWKQGPCHGYLPDGRSNICSRCDWPNEQHADEQ